MTFSAPSKKQIVIIKYVVFGLCLIPIARLIFLGFTNGLTANPIEFIERSTGFWSLIALLATLSLTPIKLITGLCWPLQLRRMLGLFMFFYACMHVTVYFWLDYNFVWVDIVTDIVKHPYVLVGLLAFILTIPLAATSNACMMRTLHKRWKQLHRLVYLISLLAIVHFWWLVKKDIREPAFYAAILIVLLGVRLFYSIGILRSKF